MPAKARNGEAETHDFLGEVLLVPNADKNDTQRIQMFTNHINQAVVLTHGEIPKVFTRFENQVGKVSSSYIQMKEDCNVIKIIARNNRRYSVIVQYKESKKVDVIQLTTATNLTEDYGYINNIPELEDWETITEINKGTLLSNSTAYDDCMNLKYGVNLKTVYYANAGMTFEDSIVISETAAKKLSHATVSKFQIPVNSNDLLLNLYGDKEHYRGLPQIGEEIRGGILCGRRRMVNMTMASQLNDDALCKMTSTDAVYYGHGVVDDIFVYCNRNVEDLNDPVYEQLRDIIYRQEAYDEELVKTLAPYREQGLLTADASFAYTRAKDSIETEDSPKKKWLSENSFDNMVIEVTVVEEKPAMVGSKITNRYGGKGVISVISKTGKSEEATVRIVPDAEMPETESGERAEVCLNPLGVLNRINPGCLYELEITAIMKQWLERWQNSDPDTKYEKLRTLMMSLSYNQLESFDKFVEENEELRDNIVNEFYAKGVPIHMPPFFGNIEFEELMDARDFLEIKETKFKGIETPMTFGYMYFIKLRHEPSSKMSVRSCGQINQKGVPNKANRNYRSRLSPYSNTPVRLGEQELANLALINDNKSVFEMLDFHSSNKADREQLISELLQKEPGGNLEVQKGSYSTVKELLKAYFTSLGLRLEPSDDTNSR
jgi:DNA-directed RNA polymerase beta subunit